MDGHQFLDRFQSLVTTRRSALGAALAVSGVTSLTPTAAKKKRCAPCKRRKKGKCKGTLPDGATCSTGTCQSGSCVAPPPLPSEEIRARMPIAIQLARRNEPP